MKSLDKLPLHDAILENIEIFWESKRSKLNVLVFTDPQASAKSYVIEFKRVSLLSIPHHEQSGSSPSINRAFMMDQIFHTEMQSGDTIEIKATNFNFRQR